MDRGAICERNGSQFYLARTLTRLRRDREAEGHLEAVIPRFRREGSDDLTEALELLARVAERSGDPARQARVEGLLQQAVDAARENRDTPIPRRAAALRALGVYRLTRKKDGVTAAPLFAEAAGLLAQVEGPTHLRVAQALAYQSAALRLQGKGPEADAVEREAESIASKHEGDQSPLAKDVRQILAGDAPAFPGP